MPLIYYNDTSKRMQVIGISSRPIGSIECDPEDTNEYTLLYADNMEWLNTFTNGNYCRIPDLIKNQKKYCKKCNLNTAAIYERIFNGTEFKEEKFGFGLNYVASIYTSDRFTESEINFR